MKVSKKCIQKMKIKNLRFLHGKIGHIWLLAFFASLFLCFLAPGISASATTTGIYRATSLGLSLGNQTTATISYSANNTADVLGSSPLTLSTDYPIRSIGINFPVNSTDEIKPGNLLNFTFSVLVRVDTSNLSQVGSNAVGFSSSCPSGGRDFTILSCLPSATATSFDEAFGSALIDGTTVYSQTFSVTARININWTGNLSFGWTAFVPVNSQSSQSYRIWISRPYLNFYDNDDAAANAIKEQEQKEKSETNAQVQAGDSAANSSSSDASASGTTLLAAAQSFVGALTSATPSNCNLDMDLGNLDLGNANLCSISPPPAFQVISSIVLIGFCVPLSIATAKKMVSLFRSFQN